MLLKSPIFHVKYFVYDKQKPNNNHLHFISSTSPSVATTLDISSDPPWSSPSQPSLTPTTIPNVLNEISFPYVSTSVPKSPYIPTNIPHIQSDSVSASPFAVNIPSVPSSSAPVSQSNVIVEVTDNEEDDNDNNYTLESELQSKVEEALKQRDSAA